MKYTRYFSGSSVSSVVKHKSRVICAICVFLLMSSLASAEFDARAELIKFMKDIGMEDVLYAPINVTQDAPGLLSIVDEGIFAVQHELVSPAVATDPNIVIDPAVKIVPTARKLCIVTHGWLDKGENRWPTELAAAIAATVDPNDWQCAAYDWKGGSIVATSVHAAKYARDIAGPRLASAITAIGTDFDHIHLIGHSAGAWTINSAAKALAEVWPDATFQLTFLDAYVPEKWNEEILGHVFTDVKRQRAQVWAEHYFVKDITWKVTEHELTNAHNVDITDIDPLVKEHEFPYRWYAATVTGKFDRWDEKKETVYTQAGKTQYGYARSREKGEANYAQSVKLKKGNKAVKVEKE